MSENAAVSEQDAFDRLLEELAAAGYVTVTAPDRLMVDAQIHEDDRVLGAVLLGIGDWGPDRTGWFVWVPARPGGDAPSSGWWAPVGPIEHEPRAAVEVADVVISQVEGIDRRPPVRWRPRPEPAVGPPEPE
ncbi:hypothetical protein [Marinitenerispora sediminis]|nr:hypothetical protein [Marinitenerispora sediminis]